MIKRGMSRTVFLIGKYAIKVPSFRNGSRLFVMGLLANLNEWDRWTCSRHVSLAQVHWCSWLGLVLIMRREYDYLDRRLTQSEVATLPLMNFDNNGTNAARRHDQIVIMDYGGTDCYLVIDP